LGFQFLAVKSFRDSSNWHGHSKEGVAYI
jgi:hypothetical protein